MSVWKRDYPRDSRKHYRRSLRLHETTCCNDVERGELALAHSPPPLKAENERPARDYRRCTSTKSRGPANAYIAPSVPAATVSPQTTSEDRRRLLKNQKRTIFTNPNLRLRKRYAESIFLNVHIRVPGCHSSSCITRSENKIPSNVNDPNDDP